MSGVSPNITGAGIGAGEGALVGTLLFPGIGTAIGAGLGAAVGGLEGGNISKLLNPAPPEQKKPITQPATPALASTTAIQSELAREQNARSTASVLTTPSGLTDEPTTTSSLLTGA